MTQDITQERNVTHGTFKDNAACSQGIKATMKAFPGWDNLPLEQREALEMIALKISRIVSGKGEYKDHWDDIEGYARLGGKVCTQ